MSKPFKRGDVSTVLCWIAHDEHFSFLCLVRWFQIFSCMLTWRSPLQTGCPLFLWVGAVSSGCSRQRFPSGPALLHEGWRSGGQTWRGEWQEKKPRGRQEGRQVKAERQTDTVWRVVYNSEIIVYIGKIQTDYHWSQIFKLNYLAEAFVKSITVL